MSSPAISAAEPAPETVPGAPESPAGEGSELTQEAAQELADNALVQVEEGGKMVVKPWAVVKAGYRHREASDRKFSEADKLNKEGKAVIDRANQALENAKKDPFSVIKWAAEQSGKSPMDVLVSMLEQAQDPAVIDRLAGVLEKRLEAEEKEKAKPDEVRRAEKAERELQEARARIDTYENQRVENEIFGVVQKALEVAGLKPDPMVAVNAIEIMMAGRNQQPPVHYKPEEVADILKAHYRGIAEGLFPRDPVNEPAKGKAPVDKSASGAGAVAKAKAEVKQIPRVTSGKKKAKDDEDEGPRSFLSNISDVYSGKMKF